MLMAAAPIQRRSPRTTDDSPVPGPAAMPGASAADGWPTPRGTRSECSLLALDAGGHARFRHRPCTPGFDSLWVGVTGGEVAGFATPRCCVGPAVNHDWAVCCDGSSLSSALWRPRGPRVGRGSPSCYGRWPAAAGTKR